VIIIDYMLHYSTAHSYLLI